MRRRIYNILIFVFAFVFMHGNVAAHEGEDHSAPKTNTSKALTHFTSFAVSDKFEVVVYYPPIKANKETTLTLFLSDYKTNAPISNAKMDISLAVDASKKFTVTQTDSGIYTVKGVFPENEMYNLTANISAGNNADLMLIKNIEVGKELPGQAEVETETHKSYNEISPVWYGLGGVLLGGILIWFLMRRRKPIR